MKCENPNLPGVVAELPAPYGDWRPVKDATPKTARRKSGEESPEAGQATTSED